MTSLPEDPASLVAAVRRGDPRSCGRLISRIEAGDADVIPVLQDLYRQGAGVPVIGITGAPGAGKSTLLDQLIAQYRLRGMRLGVLAVDPSSPFSGGAILGDRVRLARHNADPGVFIRSMSARGMLGGLARASGDALTVLDAMGVARILLETVGVGQSEVDVMRHAQSVILVLTPAAGDGIQAFKAGVLEIGDILVVNKADLPGAERAAAQLREALAHRESVDDEAWQPSVVLTRANENSGIDELMKALDSHQQHLQQHPRQWARRRREQARLRVAELVSEGLRRRDAGSGGAAARLESLLDALLQRQSDPYAAAQQLLDVLS